MYSICTLGEGSRTYAQRECVGASRGRTAPRENRIATPSAAHDTRYAYT